MQIIKKINESEFVALFLFSEINSLRFGDKLKSILEKQRCNIDVILYPNINDKSENVIREKILSEFRGYKKNEELFKTFPNNMVWYEAIIEKNEIFKIKYIKSPYWMKLSNNTRLAEEAIINIRNKRYITTEEIDMYKNGSFLLKNKYDFPPLILVSSAVDNYMVLLEGHMRLTLYCMNYEQIKTELEVVIGISNNIKKWRDY